MADLEALPAHKRLPKGMPRIFLETISRVLPSVALLLEVYLQMPTAAMSPQFPAFSNVAFNWLYGDPRAFQAAARSACYQDTANRPSITFSPL